MADCVALLHNRQTKAFVGFEKSATQIAMALGKQLPVRLDPAVEQRLESAARRAGTTKSAIIRLLAQTFVDQVVGPGGIVSLPPSWSRLLSGSDGRSRPADAIKLNCSLDDAPSAEPLPPRKSVNYEAKKRAKKKP